MFLLIVLGRIEIQMPELIREHLHLLLIVLGRIEISTTDYIKVEPNNY